MEASLEYFILSVVAGVLAWFLLRTFGGSKWPERAKRIFGVGLAVLLFLVFSIYDLSTGNSGAEQIANVISCPSHTLTDCPEPVQFDVPEQRPEPSPHTLGFQTPMVPTNGDDGLASSTLKGPIGGSVADKKIFVDSVPPGAIVSLLPRENEKAEPVELGKTPLTIDASKTPTMRFLIFMEMNDFIKQVEPIREMKDWIARFKSDQYSASGQGEPEQNYFTFDTAESQAERSGNGALVGIGPIYDLSSSARTSQASLRICALFIPRGIGREAFFPLMPKPGTFPQLEGSWPNALRSEYQLSNAQAETALQNLTRSGKYVVTIADPVIKDSGRLISFTETPDGMVDIRTYEIHLIPGYNDQP